MKSVFQVLVLGCLVAVASFAITGCNSKSAVQDKMATDKMSGDKMSGDKMSGDKMSGDKMSGDKMSDEKVK